MPAAILITCHREDNVQGHDVNVHAGCSNYIIELYASGRALRLTNAYR